MIREISNNKIFNAIIKLIAIDMMNYFVAVKRSAKMLGHYMSMLFYVSFVSVRMIFGYYKFVSMMVDVPSFVIPWLFSFKRFAKLVSGFFAMLSSFEWINIISPSSGRKFASLAKANNCIWRNLEKVSHLLSGIILIVPKICKNIYVYFRFCHGIIITCTGRMSRAGASYA